MKRKIGLKLIAFVLFGLCLLSAQKAEATLEQAFTSNTKAKKAINNLKIEDSIYEDWADDMKDMYDKRLEYINIITKKAVGNQDYVKDEAENLREQLKPCKDTAFKRIRNAGREDILKLIATADANWDKLLTEPKIPATLSLDGAGAGDGAGGGFGGGASAGAEALPLAHHNLES
jgi:hypothetical protein